MWCAITGLGMVTPLGHDAAATWHAILRGEYISRHRGVDEFAGPHRLTHMAIAAAREAMREAGWHGAIAGDPDTALVLGTSKGLIEALISGPACAPDKVARAQETPATAAMFLTIPASKVAAGIGLGGGPRLTVSCACASGLLALMRGAIMLRGGEARRVLVVAAEASVHPLFVGSFARLGVLAPPPHPCRPYDIDGHGFVMSEAAAAVCLEAGVSSGSASGRQISIEYCASGCDATNITRADAEMSVLRRMLRHIRLRGPVRLVHGHGTGTPANDPAELSAIAAALGSESEPPAVWSHKGALGHSLGAAGLLAVALNCLCHRHGVIPPMPTCRRSQRMRGVRVEPAGLSAGIARSVVAASGFGGTVAAVSLCS